MRVAYIINGLYNSAGMERIVVSKANYLAEQYGYDVTIFTTDQKGKACYYKLSSKVTHKDLSINFQCMEGFGIIRKTIGYLVRQHKFSKRFSTELLHQRFDIVVSTFGPEVNWLYKIKDGSKKIVELHFSITFRTQLNRSGLWKLADYYRTYIERKKVSYYDKLVVLTTTDAVIGKKRGNAISIPNATEINPVDKALLKNKVVIAVGRLTYYKGYDRLIQVWSKVIKIHPDWRLEIFGSGEDYKYLNELIAVENLSDSVQINKPIKNIEIAFLQSSISVLCSRHEGFGLVLIEAMACGVPCIAFDCPCGPRDIIVNGDNGYLIEDGNIQQMADALSILIEDENLRSKMGKNAAQVVVDKFALDIVMGQWNQLFMSLLNNA